MIVSQKYQDLLQPNSHDRFSKISRTFYASRKLWIIIVFLLRTLKKKLPIFLINTLLLHIPLLAHTDRQNYRGTELQRNKYTCCAWAGGSFFPVMLLCQFLVLVGNRFWLHTFVFRVQYSCDVVLVFWFWREIIFDVIRTYLVYNECSFAVVSVFDCGGK